jgi:putative membrane protein
MMGGWMVAAMAISFLIGLGLLALLVVGLVAGIRWLTKGLGASNAEPRTDRAQAILRERYARGEINRDEFERLRRDLS